MKRALQTLLCAVAMIGCARTVEIPLEPVETADPASEPQGIAPAPVDDMAVIDEGGAAGMSGYYYEPPVMPAEPPVVESAPADDSACVELAKLRALDGRIAFNDDGSATVSVALANVSDEDMLDYPGLSVWWEVQRRYAGGDGGDVLLYGLFAGDQWKHTFQAPAEALQPGSGGLMIVHAEPFSLSTRNSGVDCEPVTFEFSALVP